MKRPAITLNGIIDHLMRRPETAFVLKTITRRGAVFTFDDTLQPIPRITIEKAISRGILVDRGDSGQTYSLAEKWRGNA